MNMGEANLRKINTNTDLCEKFEREKPQREINVDDYNGVSLVCYNFLAQLVPSFTLEGIYYLYK